MHTFLDSLHQASMCITYSRAFSGTEGYEPLSAGTRPHDINPIAIEAMREVGIDISKQAKSMWTFQ